MIDVRRHCAQPADAGCDLNTGAAQRFLVVRLVAQLISRGDRPLCVILTCRVSLIQPADTTADVYICNHFAHVLENSP